MRFSGIHQRTLSWEDLKITISKTRLEITFLESHSDHPGANELKKLGHFFFLKMCFYFLMLFLKNESVNETGPIQWIFNEHCKYWWPGALTEYAPVHFWAIYGLILNIIWKHPNTLENLFCITNPAKHNSLWFCNLIQALWHHMGQSILVSTG